MLRLNALRHRVRFGAESLLERIRNAHSGVVPAEAGLLISVHVPKTAGTSFRRFLGAAYGRRLFFDYGPHNPMTTGLVKRSMYPAAGAGRGQELRRAFEARQVACIHGHFPARAYLDVFPEADYALWLRDPVDRVVSLYYAHIGRLKPGQEEYEGMGLLDYARHDANRDLQSKMIDGVPAPRILFMGVSERFRDSLRRLAEGIHAPLELAQDIQLNVNVRRPTHEPPEVREEIAALNANDVALYREALRRFEDRGA